jgi:excisionase family DNA binding protein
MENTDFMTVSEVARMLRLSQVTVNRLIRRNELQAYRFGKVYRIPKYEVERFLNASHISSHEAKPDNNKEGFSTVESLMKHFGAWAGGKEDAEKVLKHILDNRVDAEF